MPQGWDLEKVIFKHGHVAYQIDEDDEQNRMQVKILSYGQTGDLGVRSKVKYHLIPVTMSISKIFIPNFVSVLTNERYKTCQTFFFILLPGSCPRGGTWGYLGAKIKFCPAVCPLCYLLLNHWTKFNQIWCVSYSHKWGAQCKIFLAPPPWALGRGQKAKYHLTSITKSFSKIFIPNFVCVLTNERYKTYQMGFLFCHWVMPQGWDLEKVIFQHGHVAYQIDEDDEQNRMQVKILSYGQTDDLGVRSKVKYHLILVTMSISKIFIPNFVCVLTNERYKTYQTGFLFCHLGHAPGVGFWGTGGAQEVIFFQTWSCGISN